ncbi:unnamed protein product [Prorocentrum cordatum]|uniref:Uncharacterized protein n=1 Tax=Prorocentrum cordatum TaxID=2364126 RepID=A0ABN9SLK7_9DINO|nr:unnamed protein product [Polarella glacialis]
MTHARGESCWKYSGNKTTKICRHGFYCIVTLVDWRRCRRGKPLLTAMFAVRSLTRGMQGRPLHFQLRPSECITDHVSDPRAWLDKGEELPRVGSRPNSGYTSAREPSDADAWVKRPEVLEEPLAWTDDCSLEEWRDIMLQCPTKHAKSEDTEDAGATAAFADQLDVATQVTFSDGLNMGFYINSHATEQCPGMEDVLAEMRRGLDLERLQAQRQA